MWMPIFMDSHNNSQCYTIQNMKTAGIINGNISVIFLPSEEFVPSESCGDSINSDNAFVTIRTQVVIPFLIFEFKFE